MAFQDIFEETRKKLSGYFGVGRPGLGTFGQQVKNTFKPVANLATRKLPSFNAFNTARQQMPRFQGAVSNIARNQVNKFVQPKINAVKNTINLADRVASRAIDRTQNYRNQFKVRGYSPSDISLTGQVTKLAKPMIQGTARSVASLVPAITKKPIQVNTTARRALVGNQYQDIQKPTIEGVRQLQDTGFKESTAKKYGPAFGVAMTALDVIPGMGGKDDLVKGLVKATTKSGVKKLLPKIADDVAETIAKTTDAKAIRNLIKPQKVADALSNEARKYKSAEEFSRKYLKDLADENRGVYDMGVYDKFKEASGVPLYKIDWFPNKVNSLSRQEIDKIVAKYPERVKQLSQPKKWGNATIKAQPGEVERSILFEHLKPEYDNQVKKGLTDFYNQSQPLSPQSTPSALSNEARKTRATFDDNIPQNKLKNQLAEDTKSIIDGAEVKERSFGKRVKLSENTPKEVKELVGGSYVVKSNKKLTADAKNLIRTNIDVADQMAMNPRNANDIEVGNQLIVHYQNQGNFQKAADIANAMNKSLTEGGQFVQAASLYDKTTPGGIQRLAQAEVEKFNKANPNKKIKIDDKTMESLFKRAEKIQKMAEGRDRSIAVGELFNEVADIIPTSNWKKAIILWKAGLLTSFRTHERNLVGNTLNVGGEIAKDPIAAVMDALMSTRTGSRTKTFTLSGMGKGTVKGASSAKDYLYKGFDPEKTIEKFDVKRINWGKSKLGKVAQAYTEGVFRALGAGDKPFYHSALTRSLYDQAGAKAINAGKRGNKQFIENLVTNPTDDMLKIATRDAEIAVFQQSTTAGNMLSSLKKKLKDKGEFAEAAGEFFLPFTQVPSGVGSQLISYSPAGLTQGVLNTARTMITKDAGLQRQAAEQMGRGIVGTGIMALGYELYRSGNMTGKYPADAKEREQWKLEGKQENSVKIGGKWRKLSAIGPQASILVTGAQLAESVEEGDASALSVASSAGSEFLDQPFVQGMSVPLDVLKDPERNVKKFSNQASASLIPNIVKDVSRGLDPYKREAETAGESIRKSIPLMRNDLPPMRDAYGEPLPEEGGVIKNMFDLFNSLTPKGDDTTKELRRLLDAGEGATPSRLQNSQTIAGEKLKLKNAELDEIEKIAGPMTKQGFDQMIKTPEYQEMSDEDKKKALQKITEDARAVAKLQAAESKNLVDVDTLIEKSKKLTKDQKELLSGGTFASVKRDYDLDKQIDLLDGSYGKLAFLKKKKDFATWQTEAEGLMKMYEEKYTNAETEADKMKYELKIIKLAEEMQKYAGYGGFKKAKKGKKIKFSAFDSSTTSGIKIPISKATKPNFKKITSTPKIPVSTKARGITKSYLANLR